MKLKRVLHPEVVLDKRGDLTIRKVFKKLLDNVLYSPNGFTIPGDSSLSDMDIKKVKLGKHSDGLFIPKSVVAFNIARMLSKPEQSFFGVLKRVRKGECSYFYIPSEFLNALSNMDRELQIEYLPKEFFGYFALPESNFSIDGMAVQDVYVLIETDPFIKVHSCTVGFFNGFDGDNPNYKAGFSAVTIPLKNEKVRDIINELPNVSIVEAGAEFKIELEVVVRSILNAVIYIYSEDPEIKKVLPIMDFGLSIRQRRERKAIQEKDNLENHCALPIKVINHQFHSNRMYFVDKTTVRAHTRWLAPMGKRAKHKFVPVREHVRNYKNVIELSQNHQVNDGISSAQVAGDYSADSALQSNLENCKGSEESTEVCNA